MVKQISDYQKTEKGPETDKSFRTLFLILLPSLLLSINYGNIILNIASKILLLLLQFVIVKGILDEYYKYQ